MTNEALSSPELSEVYRAAGEPIRLQILELLAHGERCVCDLHGALGAPQPTVSRHLAILRRADLVRTRRAGSWVHYRLSEVAERWLAPALAEWRADPSEAARRFAPRACS
jgi:ArsR family transcriptional regulator, arsenate/arsenite/antimonite-responsive transcriptional repressor